MLPSKLQLQWVNLLGLRSCILLCPYAPLCPFCLSGLSIKLMNSSEGSNEGLKWGSQRRTWRCAVNHMEQIRFIIICLTFLLGGLLIILAWSTDHLTEQSIRVKWPLPAFFWVITIIAGRSGYPHLRLHLIVIFAHRGKCLLCNNYE